MLALFRRLLFSWRGPTPFAPPATTPSPPPPPPRALPDASWGPLSDSRAFEAPPFTSAASRALHTHGQHLCNAAFLGDMLGVQQVLASLAASTVAEFAAALTHADLYKRGHSSTALGLAALRGHCDCVQLLLHAQPALARRTNERGDTPLMLAAGGQKFDCLMLLLPHSDPCQRQIDGWDALRFAIHAQAPKCIRALLPCSDLTAVDARGAHALSGAAHFGSEHCLVLLLDALADTPTGVPAAAAFHALHLSIRRQHWSCADRLAPHVPISRSAPLLEGVPPEWVPRWMAWQEQQALSTLLRSSDSTATHDPREAP